MNETRTKSWLLGIGSAFMVAFSLIPVVYMVVVSVSPASSSPAGGGWSQFTIAHYRAILESPSLHFIVAMKNSVIVSGLSAVFTIFMAGLAAYAITRLEVPGKLFILFLVLAVSAFPQISLISYLFRFMTRLGWVNTYQGLVLPYAAWGLPLALWILVSAFQQVPRDLDLAAQVDGCSPWQILWKVLGPVAAPGIFSAALLAFIFAFNEFLFALLLTTDYRARTVPVGIALFQGLHGETPWGTIMAASTFSTVPLVILTLFFQKYIIQGLTRGAVKG